MSNLSKTFKNKKVLITYITAGDPSLAVTEKLVLEMEKAGADVIELGIPFSDPLADGPTIQASHERALAKKVTPADVFKLVSSIRKRSQVPICLMFSYNLMFNYGVEKFIEKAQAVGVDGLIIPDLPPEESKLKSNYVDFIFLVAPTSTEERIKLTAEHSTGFIYLVSTTGITGVRKEFSKKIAEVVKKIRKYSDKPIAIGFGISNPAQAAQAAKIADGVIVGSAIVKIIAKHKTASVKKVGQFVALLKRAIS